MIQQHPGPQLEVHLLRANNLTQQLTGTCLLCQPMLVSHAILIGNYGNLRLIDYPKKMAKWTRFLSILYVCSAQCSLKTNLRKQKLVRTRIATTSRKQWLLRNGWCTNTQSVENAGQCKNAQNWVSQDYIMVKDMFSSCRQGLHTLSISKPKRKLGVPILIASIWNMWMSFW